MLDVLEKLKLFLERDRAEVEYNTLSDAARMIIPLKLKASDEMWDAIDEVEKELVRQIDMLDEEWGFSYHE